MQYLLFMTYSLLLISSSYYARDPAYSMTVNTLNCVLSYRFLQAKNEVNAFIKPRLVFYYTTVGFI